MSFVPSSSRLIVLLATLAVAASACAEIGDPDLGEGLSGPASTEAPAETDGDDAAEADEVISATIAPVFAPSRDESYEPSLLLGTATGLLAIDGADGSALPELTTDDFGAPFSTERVERVVDDYLGGAVAQLENGVVEWLPADATDPQLLSQGTGMLLDVGFLDATLAVQLFLAVPGGIDRIKMVDGERENFVTLADGEDVIAFSASNGIQAVALTDNECGSLQFLNVSGQPVDLGGPDRPECRSQRRPRFGAVAMSPDGGAVAYTEVTYRGDGLPAATRLIALELGSGTELLSLQVGGPSEQIESLAYDGRRLTYLRTGGEGRELVVLVVGEGVERIVEGDDVEGVQHVTFARLPLSIPTVDELAAEANPEDAEPPAEGEPAEGGG